MNARAQSSRAMLESWRRNLARGKVDAAEAQAVADAEIAALQTLAVEAPAADFDAFADLLVQWEAFRVLAH